MERCRLHARTRNLFSETLFCFFTVETSTKWKCGFFSFFLTERLTSQKDELTGWFTVSESSSEFKEQTIVYFHILVIAQIKEPHDIFWKVLKDTFWHRNVRMKNMRFSPHPVIFVRKHSALLFHEIGLCLPPSVCPTSFRHSFGGKPAQIMVPKSTR